MLQVIFSLFSPSLLLSDFSVGRSRKLHKLLKYSGGQKKEKGKKGKEKKPEASTGSDASRGPGWISSEMKK